MIVPIVLALFSFAGIGVSLALQQLSDFILLAAPCAVASIFLLLRGYFHRGITGKKPLKLKFIVLDGSNIMHWKDGKPHVEAVREVVQYLKGQGYSPGVVFDANAGHILF